MADTSGYVPYQYAHSGFPSPNSDYTRSTIWTGETRQPSPQINIDIESLAEKIMNKMYNAPVIVVCNYCNSCNAITNANCVRCNGPLGEATRRNIGSVPSVYTTAVKMSWGGK